MNGKKDPRYKTLKIVIDAGGVKAFKDIFRIVPKSIISKDMHTNNNRMQALIDNPGNFTYAEIADIASLIGCDYKQLRDLVEKAAGLAGAEKPVKKSKTKQ